MTDISPFGSIASASNKSSTSSSSVEEEEESGSDEESTSSKPVSSEEESTTSSKPTSSKSTTSNNPSQQSPSEEDSEEEGSVVLDDYYSHIRHREDEVETSIPKGNRMPPPTKPAVAPKPKQSSNKEQVTHSSQQSSHKGTLIDIGTEIETTPGVPTEETKKKEKVKAKKKNIARRKQKQDIVYPSELSRNVAGGTKRISWNSDPNASFSDWRVEVLVRETQERQLFYLHRNIVGFGPRKSEFLKEAFAQQQDRKENMTKLILPEYQAKVFPMVLDYIYYTREARQNLTASRACAMYNIAERLEIISLEKAIMEFYRKSTSLENVAEFFKCAKEADALQLIAVSKAKIGTMIIQKPELGKLVPPSFLIEIIEIYREEFGDIRKKNPRGRLQTADLVQSKRLSIAAYLCVGQSKNTINEELLDKLTNETALPVIDVAVALPFLNLSAKFEKGSSEYTNLQRRCVKSITQNWPKFQKQFSSSEKVSNALKKLPSHVLADILVMTMHR
ncbi:unnamed protein product [Cylindrotheca closterium]|uniref:BTB domain-containing protein n=1 Tax=Cylindrotheca closterium TaxID=2856 RepID=A0AAD2FDN9_9STRA|nr:unnamed protein product [Cylindrotheca closterium]